jgi:transcription elongation factor GreA
MSEKQVFLTPEGLAKLQAELEYLRTVRRPEVASRIQQAKEFGNTVDNAEYDDAKNTQAFVEGRILTLERMIRNAEIIHEDSSQHETVKLGSKVTVCNADGEVEHYVIVGSAEASPRNGKISNESPVGRSLLGRRPGEEVQIVVPAGVIRLKILEIA